MGHKSLTAVDRSSSILGRVSSQANSPLTEAQALTDQLVSVSIQECTNLKTAAAMLGAGWVGRATRIGALTTLPGQAFARGASYIPALAAESAAFAGIERGFHPSSQPFQKDWARAAVTLTGLKAFGGLSQGQNIVLQHLFTDLGLVGGHQAAHAVGLMDKPQGNFAQQMLYAEATNWQMKGSLAFAHSFSPRLLATEKSLDLYLKGQETNLFSQGRQSPLFSQLATEGAPESFLANPIKSEGPKGPDVLQMSGSENNGDSGKKNGGLSPAEGSPREMGAGEPLSFESLAERAKMDRSAVEGLRSLIIQQNDVRAVHALVEAARTNPVDAIWALQDLNPNGNKAEQAACEVQRTIDVGPLVEAIKTNPQGVYWLRNLKDAGNAAAGEAIETFDVTEMAERAKTDWETHLALKVLGFSGNKMAQSILGPVKVSLADLSKAKYPKDVILETLREYSNAGISYHTVREILDKAEFSVEDLHAAYTHMEAGLVTKVRGENLIDGLSFLQAMNHTARLLAAKGEKGSGTPESLLGQLKNKLILSHAESNEKRLEGAVALFRAYALQTNPSVFEKGATGVDLVGPGPSFYTRGYNLIRFGGFITCFDYLNLIGVDRSKLEIIEGKKTPPSGSSGPGGSGKKKSPEITPSDRPPTAGSRRLLHWGDRILDLAALTTEDPRIASTERLPDARTTNDPADPSLQPESIKRRFHFITTRLASDPRPPETVMEEILATDSDPTARVAAAETLGAWGEFAARPTLKRALSDSSPEVREAADGALKKLKLAEGSGTASPNNMPEVRIQKLNLQMSDPSWWGMPFRAEHIASRLNFPAINPETAEIDPPSSSGSEHLGARKIADLLNSSARSHERARNILPLMNAEARARGREELPDPGFIERHPTVDSDQAWSWQTIDFQARLRTIAGKEAEGAFEEAQKMASEGSLLGRFVLTFVEMAREKVRTGEISAVTPESFLDELYQKMPEAEKVAPLKYFLASFGVGPSPLKEPIFFLPPKVNWGSKTPFDRDLFPSSLSRADSRSGPPYDWHGHDLYQYFTGAEVRGPFDLRSSPSSPETVGSLPKNLAAYDGELSGMSDFLSRHLDQRKRELGSVLSDYDYQGFHLEFLLELVRDIRERLASPVPEEASSSLSMHLETLMPFLREAVSNPNHPLSALYYSHTPLRKAVDDVRKDLEKLPK